MAEDKTIVKDIKQSDLSKDISRVGAGIGGLWGSIKDVGRLTQAGAIELAQQIPEYVLGRRGQFLDARQNAAFQGLEESTSPVANFIKAGGIGRTSVPIKNTAPAVVAEAPPNPDLVPTSVAENIKPAGEAGRISGPTETDLNKMSPQQFKEHMAANRQAPGIGYIEGDGKFLRLTEGKKEEPMTIRQMEATGNYLKDLGAYHHGIGMREAANRKDITKPQEKLDAFEKMIEKNAEEFEYIDQRGVTHKGKDKLGAIFSHVAMGGEVPAEYQKMAGGIMKGYENYKNSILKLHPERTSAEDERTLVQTYLRVLQNSQFPSTKEEEK